MGPRARIGLGIALILIGALVTLNYVGIYFIADCPPGCQARGEQLVVIALAIVGLAIAGVGAWVVRGGVRARRA